MSRTLPRQALVALILAADAILLAAGWFIVVAPQRAHARSVAHAAALTRAQVEAVRSYVPSTPTTSAPKQPEIRTSLLYRLSKAMPSTEDQPDLLLQINQVARAAGVTLLTVAPAPPTAGDGFTTVPISLTASGDFYSLTDMLYRLRTLVAVRHGGLNASGRLFAVQSVTLTPTGTGNELTADVGVDAYVYGTALVAGATGATTTTATTATTGTATTTTTGTTTSG